MFLMKSIGKPMVFQFFQLFEGCEVLEPGAWARLWARGLEAAPRPQNHQTIGTIGKTISPTMVPNLPNHWKNWKTIGFPMLFTKKLKNL